MSLPPSEFDPIKQEPDVGRKGIGQLRDKWAEKLPEEVTIGVYTPWLQRRWLRNLALSLFVVGGLGTAVALGFFNNWKKDQGAEYARQRQGLTTFCQSPEFARFQTEMVRQFAALHNYIVIHPGEAKTALPLAAAHEQAHRKMPWAQQISVLPISAATQPHVVLRATREVSKLLADRDVVFEEPVRKEARQMYLKSLAPYIYAFSQRARDTAFPALPFDRGMQEQAIGAFAAHLGPDVTTAEVERMFSLYARIGPSLWQAIEKEREAQQRAALPFGK